ncbi:adenylate cyclase type 10-like [Limosa lapponica baueri]|uniref:Adenylate cyclase type 10-like n=1 Tax=Limosa lapponica baueri TaxID=1758121 RepID=A0A2I0T086_LIMLA|nr:adenylate cyclase type 10-like [Limosa lapponica baueri]
MFSLSLKCALSQAVIGQKVNLAAWMMVHYPGLVSWDAVTYAASRLPPYYFRELPEREMKGISQPGPVCQYVGITKESKHVDDVHRAK